MLLTDRSLTTDQLVGWLHALGFNITKFAVATVRRSFLDHLRVIEEHVGTIKPMAVPDYLLSTDDDADESTPPTKPKKKKQFREWDPWPRD